MLEQQRVKVGASSALIGVPCDLDLLGVRGPGGTDEVSCVGGFGGSARLGMLRVLSRPATVTIVKIPMIAGSESGTGVSGIACGYVDVQRLQDQRDADEADDEPPVRQRGRRAVRAAP
jgi:hypothetical protein